MWIAKSTLQFAITHGTRLFEDKKVIKSAINLRRIKVGSVSGGFFLFGLFELAISALLAAYLLLRYPIDDSAQN